MTKNTMGIKLPRKLEQKMSVVGEQIKLARLRRNLSVAQVVERAICPPLTVSRIEKGVPRKGFPLNSCNSSINRAVTFFIIGRGNEKATVLSSVFCVWIHSLKQLKLR